MLVEGRPGRSASAAASRTGVDAGRLAGEKAAGRAVGGVYASDAFFPFPDGLDGAVEAGATVVVQPGGSIRDDEVIAAADEPGWPWSSPASATSATDSLSTWLTRRGFRPLVSQLAAGQGRCQYSSHDLERPGGLSDRGAGIEARHVRLQVEHGECAVHRVEAPDLHLRNPSTASILGGRDAEPVRTDAGPAGRRSR